MLLHHMIKEKTHLQEQTLFELDFGVNVTCNVAQYPQHHVTFATAKFDVATSCTVPMYLQSLKLLQPVVKEMHLQKKNTI